MSNDGQFIFDTLYGVTIGVSFGIAIHNLAGGICAALIAIWLLNRVFE